MNDQEYMKLRSIIFSKVARCIPAPVEELALHLPHFSEVRQCYHATVYWGSLYICEAEIKGDVLVLYAWRPLYADRGRLEWPLTQEA